MEIDALKASSPDSTIDHPLSPKTQLRIINLELSQGQLWLRITEKQRQLSSQRILPLELFEIILIYAHCFYHIPRITLALVCHTWHLAVINTPRLWSDISVVSACAHGGKRPAEWLRQRIERAKGVSLDVTLSASCSPFAGTDYGSEMIRETAASLKVVKRLHKLVFATETSRWRSLQILDGTRPLPLTASIAVAATQDEEQKELRRWVSGKLQGPSFPRLQALNMRTYAHVPHEDIYECLYAAVEKTATRLEACFFNEQQLPVGFLKEAKRILARVFELKSSVFMLDSGAISTFVRCLHLPSNDSGVDFTR